MKNNNKKEISLYKTLSFQYKPIEKKMFADVRKVMKKEDADQYIKRYKKFSDVKKIMMLDRVAGVLGL